MTPIKITLVGMDERSLIRMGTIFKVVFKGRCEIGHPEDASLAVVDLDVETGVWETFLSQHKSLPAIVLSESPSSAEGAIYIAKPAKLDLLWQSILRLSQGVASVGDVSVEDFEEETITSELMASTDDDEQVEKTAEELAVIDNEQHVTSETVAQSEPVQNTTDVLAEQTEVSQVVDKDSFDPDEYLLGTILKKLHSDGRRQCTIHMHCCEDRQLILIPDENKVFTDLTDDQLKSLCECKFDESTPVEINSICGTGTGETKSLWYRAYARLLGKGDLPTVGTDGLKSMPLNYLLWMLAQYTARGRVPVGTDLSKPVYLQCWPNFTRLPQMENGMRIASLWVGNPYALDEIALRLGIDIAEVYSFYSAAAVCGLARNENRQAGNLVSPPEKRNKRDVEKGLRDAILRLTSVAH